jgi:hypothetical protein
MLSIIGIKKTIKQHTADMDITDSVDYKISAPPRPHLLYNPYRPNTVIYYFFKWHPVFIIALVESFFDKLSNCIGFV